MTVYAVLVALSLLVVGLASLLVVAVRRLLQLDRFIGDVVDVVDAAAAAVADLTKRGTVSMSPEVTSIHRVFVAVRERIESIVADARAGRPAGLPKPPPVVV